MERTAWYLDKVVTKIERNTRFKIKSHHRMGRREKTWWIVIILMEAIISLDDKIRIMRNKSIKDNYLLNRVKYLS